MDYAAVTLHYVLVVVVSVCLYRVATGAWPWEKDDGSL